MGLFKTIMQFCTITALSAVAGIVVLRSLQTSSPAPEPVPHPQKEPPSAPPVQVYWFNTTKHLRVRNEPNGPEIKNGYIVAGSCVKVAAADAGLSDAFTYVSAYAPRAHMRFGLVPSETLAFKREQPRDGVCSAKLVDTPDGAPLPPQPDSVPPPHQARPDTRSGFKMSQFYTVQGDIKMRQHPDQGKAPFVFITDGSCVQQFEVSPDARDFAHVSAFGTNKGQLLSGWVLKDFLNPADVSTTEQTCLATFKDVPSLPRQKLRMP